MALSQPILTILNEIGSLVGIPEQEYVFGSAGSPNPPTNEYARVMRSVTHDAVSTLLRERMWEDTWRLAQFTVSAGDDFLPLPPDMDRFRTETFFQQNQGWWRPQGPVPDDTWRFFNNYSINTVQPLWRFGEGTLILRPAIEEDMTFEFEYITKWPIVAVGGQTKERITFDSDMALFDSHIFKQELKWRLKKERGEDWSEDRRLCMADKDMRKAQDGGGAKKIVLGKPYIDLYSLAPYTDDGSTINVPLF